MHLLDSYSLSSASKINKPFILEKYFPLTAEKYITLQPQSKGSKTYDLTQEVIDLILPVLRERNITIIQIGGPNEKPLNGCFHTQGQTSINQMAYIIKGGLLYFGMDSIGAHIAGSYNKKIVALYSNNHINCVKPFWGDPKNQILLEPDRINRKPNFTLDENPKTINEIKPEIIAGHICNLLDLKCDFPYKTVSFGQFYNHPRLIEMTPDYAINISNLGIDSIIVRMDFLFNESILANQMSICPVSIVTDRPINLDLLAQFKPRIKQIVYMIDKNHNVKFVNAIQKGGFNYAMMSYLTNEELNDFKLDYLEYGLIHRKEASQFKDSNVDKLYFKTNKFTLGREKIYMSHAHYLADKPVPNLSNNFSPIINNLEFLRETDYMYLTEKA